MRVDFNVSIDDGVIGEDYRIRMAIPTIEYLTKRGAKLILMSIWAALEDPKKNTHYNLLLKGFQKYLQSIKSNSPMTVLAVQ